MPAGAQPNTITVLKQEKMPEILPHIAICGTFTRRLGAAGAMTGDETTGNERRRCAAAQAGVVADARNGLQGQMPGTAKACVRGRCREPAPATSAADQCRRPVPQTGAADRRRRPAPQTGGADRRQGQKPRTGTDFGTATPLPRRARSAAPMRARAPPFRSSRTPYNREAPLEGAHGRPSAGSSQGWLSWCGQRQGRSR